MEDKLIDKYFYNPECMERFINETPKHKGGISLSTSMALYSNKIERVLKKNLYELEPRELMDALPLIGRIYTLDLRRDVSNIVKYMEWAYKAGLRKTQAINARHISYYNINMDEVYKRKMYSLQRVVCDLPPD